MSLTDQLAELDKKREALLKNLEREAAILPQLPDTGFKPRVFFAEFRDVVQPWVTYEVETLAEALNIIKLFGPRRTVAHHRNGCSCSIPKGWEWGSYTTGKSNVVWEVEDYVALRQEVGFHYCTWTLVCYPEREPWIMLRVKVSNLPESLCSTIKWRRNERNGAIIYRQGEPVIDEINHALGDKDYLHKVTYKANTSIDFTAVWSGLEFLETKL